MINLFFILFINLYVSSFSFSFFYYHKRYFLWKIVATTWLLYSSYKILMYPRLIDSYLKASCIIKCQINTAPPGPLINRRLIEVVNVKPHLQQQAASSDHRDSRCYLLDTERSVPNQKNLEWLVPRDILDFSRISFTF